MAQDSLLQIGTRHQSHFERLKSHEVGNFDPFLKQIDTDIRDILTRKGSGITRRALKRQLDMIEVGITGAFSDYHEVWKQSTKDIAIAESGFEQRTLENVFDGVNFQLPSDAQIIAAVNAAPIAAAGGKVIDVVYKDFTKTETKRIANIIRLGFAEGQTTQQIITRVRGTNAAKFRDGTLAQVKRAQEALVRTTLQTAASVAREQVLKANDDVVDGVQWVATLDARTGSADAALDGKFFPFDKGPRPSLHPNCRCTIIGHLNHKYRALSKGRTRAARDVHIKDGKLQQGKSITVQNKSYYSWLKSQPAKVQNSIIGPSRGKLLRNGGISSERFAELSLGKNFEPLNLKQMRELDPVAFMKAGL